MFKLNILSSFKKIIHSSLLIYMSKVSTILSSFLLTILIARFIGPQEYGQFSIAISLFLLFFMISQMGMENYLISEVSKKPDEIILLVKQSALLGVTVACLSGFTMVGIGSLLNYSKEVQELIFILSLTLIPAFLNALLESVYIGMEKPTYIFFGSVTRMIFLLGISFWGIKSGFGIKSVAWAMFFARIVGLGILLCLFSRLNLSSKKKNSWDIFKKFGKIMSIFILINLLTQVMFELDILILSKTMPEVEIGFYSLAKKVVRMSFIILFSTIMAMYPTISKAFTKSKEEVISLCKSFMKITVFLSAAIMGCLYIFSKYIITLLFGIEYLRVVEIINILLWMIMPLSLSFLLSRFLISGNYPKKDLKAVFICLIMLLLSGSLLTHYFGIYGMAVANISSITILFGAHYFFVKKYIINPFTNTRQTH